MTASLLFIRNPVADGTAANTAQEIARFEGLGCLGDKHLVDGGKPEAIFIGKIVTSTATVALKERIVAESSETGTGRGKRLTTATTTSSSVLTRKKKLKLR